MSTKFALGLAFGQKLAENAGVSDPGARRRAGIILGAVGLTPVGLLVTKTLVDREAEAELERQGEEPGKEGGGTGVTGRPARGGSSDAPSGPSGSEGGRTKSP